MACGASNMPPRRWHTGRGAGWCPRCRARKRAGAARIAEDVDTADLSDVTGTPTFFINGRRHYGSYDMTALTSAVLAAKAVAATPAR